MTRRTVLGWVAAMGTAGVLAVVVVPPVDSGRAASGVIGTMVPDVTITDINGQVISSAAWRGKVTLVNFWATWCGPCQVEIPQFVALQKAHPDTLQIVGLSLDDSVDAVRVFVVAHQMTYPVALVDQEFDHHFGGVVGLPTTFVVDPAGRIVSRHVGLVDTEIYEEEIGRHGRSRGAGDQRE